ncbi:PatA/PatG family cyanobactin maturation protease [Limnospira sp. PMC 1042.18]|uniref:PatA/PatG family cyanobactin maturation protease n=1 Tax=Limnospira sp. PMC 1042.18 TaxID=2981018 RepID=UPI0028E13EC5|nr:PatA/PatG family cyanobactin maturation protease [Limnospira sp. PMC 1042.18]MDT9200437.1 PatA/PatG family cyanobactin maturation protease [Limnospira sp. PMC 1042.18]
MRTYPFAISLNSTIQVSTTADGYALSPANTDPSQSITPSMVTLPAITGMGDALAHLQEGTATLQQLTQTLSAQEGREAGEQLAATLQQMGDRGWLQYGVLPLAIAVPMVESAELNLDSPHWTRASVSLSRFAYQRSHEGGMVLESPLSKFRVKLLDWRASAILAQLAQPLSLRRVTPPPQIGAETAYQFLNLLWATGFLSIEAEAPELKLWEFHNLLFHSRCRQGRHDYPTGDIAASLEVWDEFPVVKPPMSGQIVALPQMSIDAIRQRDKTLTTAIEQRASIREYDENHPITIEQLGELLYRTARIKEIYTHDAEQTELLKAQFGEDFDWGEISRRPYPCGGAMYELEIYLAVRRCEGVKPGLYHYDPLNHQLAQIDAADADIQALLKDAHQSSGEQGMPQVLLIITARFGRLFRKYRSLAYALVLKHVGVLYQNLYLVATNMGLAPCSLGAGDSDRFAQATGLDYIVESSVGEFMLGSLPNVNIAASGVEDSVADNIQASEELAVEAIAIEAESASVEPSELETPATLHPSELDSDIEATEVESASVEPSELETINPSELEDSVGLSAVETQGTTAHHPHDLDDRIPGLAELRNQTLGDPRITIVILDGNPDHTLSCFAGAEISKVFPYWHEPAEPVPTEAYWKFQAIGKDDTLDKDQKAEAQKAAFPEPLLKRIHGDNHACHITSTIVGQENTPSPGLAPRCRVINVPLNTSSTDEEFISPLNLARAFELGLELGANIIHCAACRPTQTGEGEEILLQALKKCQDNNILIVAPAGNNKGECWCMPASLPGVLSVGALKPDGTPYKFSNWGGNNALEGIMAPGGEILGAQPANEEPVRLLGTSMAAPVMTGLCGLLMSLQLQQGKPVDAEAVRAALLNTAIPCTPEDTDEPERCLRGKVNLPGAMGLLFGSGVTISFAGDRVNRTEHSTLGVNAIGSAVGIEPSAVKVSDVATQTPATESLTASASLTPADVQPSKAGSGHVFALGTIGYDFGDEARRDTFKQTMAPVNLNGVMVPPDPYDARQMVEHLDNHPDAAYSLIWTLNLDQNTIYALDPKGPFADDIYEMFLLMLNGQLEPETSAEFIERVSIPGRQTERTVELFSGEVVPVLNVRNPRGMYGWNINRLVDAALGTLDHLEEGSEGLLREGLTAFLNRVYYELHNVGKTSRDRALNFAVTNTFQAAATFAEAIAADRRLDTIEVEKSPYCRLNSDCWDVLLTFFDPEDGKRSRQVFRFTIDVADSMPVTVGSIKRWAIPGKKRT